MKTTIKKWSTLLAAAVLGFTLNGCSSTDDSAGHNSHYEMPQYHVGTITPQQLLNQYKIFADHKANDVPKITDLEVRQLAHQLNNRKMVVVFGTWCHDSQREVPRLLTLLERVRDEYPKVSFEFEMIAAAPYEMRDKNLIKKYQLTAVPTIMLFDKEQEMGRVVEQTKISLAADITNMKL